MRHRGLPRCGRPFFDISGILLTRTEASGPPPQRARRVRRRPRGNAAIMPLPAGLPCDARRHSAAPKAANSSAAHTSYPITTALRPSRACSAATSAQSPARIQKSRPLTAAFPSSRAEYRADQLLQSRAVDQLNAVARGIVHRRARKAAGRDKYRAVRVRVDHRAL